MPSTPLLRQSSLGLGAAVVLCVLGLVAGGLSAWAAATSSVLVSPDAVAVLRGALVVAYATAGVLIWHRRPGDRFAPLMVLVGLGYTATAAITSGDPTIHTVGRLITAAWITLFLYTFLAFPAGRLGSRFDRAIIGGYVLTGLLLWPIVVLLARKVPAAGPFTDCGDRCPENGLRVANVSSTAWHVPYAAVTVATTLAAVATVAMLARKVWAPLGVQRRTVAPVLLAAAVVLVSYVLIAVHSSGTAFHTVSLVLAGIGALLVPVAFVFGPLRGELFVSRSLWRSLSGVDYSRFSLVHAEEVCRRALGDGTLRLVVSAPEAEGFYDVDGRAVTLPGVDGDPTVTRFARGGVTYAVIHDRTLGSGYHWLVERVGELACTLIEYGRLFRDVVFSRQRIAEAEGEERIRLERDLHDGAQQRLLAIRMKLAELERAVDGSDLAEPVLELSRDAAFAVEEVRRIAHGIYPPILLERGLPDAFRDLPTVPGLSIEIVDNGIGRLPAATERAIYFAVVEAMQNATRHAGARSVVVVLEPFGEAVEIMVEDDGGGFDPGLVPPGKGLTGMRDRIGSVGGTVEVGPRPGGGTSVRYFVPLAPGDSGKMRV